MTDQEKVIKALECCLTSKYPPCDECGYDGDANYNDAWSCRLSLMADALTLLKAQRSRVMTLKEVKQWSETHPHKQNPIWIEFQPKRGTDGWRVCLFNSEILTWCKNNEARCWTSQPTDEQRKAVPWNTQK